MKNTKWIILSLLVVFDVIFYHEQPGVNVFIFNVLLVIGSYLVRPKLVRETKWQLLSLACLVSAVSVMIYGDDMSFFANLLSLAFYAAVMVDFRSSLITAIPGMMLTYVSSPVHAIRNGIARGNRLQENAENQSLVKLVLILVSILVVLVFFFIYRGSSVAFYSFTQKINLDFISLSWILFTVNGFLLLYSFFNYSGIKKLGNSFDYAEITIVNTEPSEPKKNQLEQFTYILLLSLLNILILLVNILDYGVIAGNGLPKGVTYSEYLHQGVGLLIFSIVLALSIILYFFRGSLNFSNNKWIKLLAYVWIVQNGIILITNMLRNNMYIEAYGLTEKRIGVYFYLLFALIGLYTTFIKVKRAQSNVYLFRVNSYFLFVIIIVSSLINWSAIITAHDLKRSDADINFTYLCSLSNSNLPMLLEYSHRYGFADTSTLQQQKLASLHEKVLQELHNRKQFPNWPSATLIGKSNATRIAQFSIKTLYINQLSKRFLDHVNEIKGLECLIARNVVFFNPDELSKVTALKKLDISNTRITNLNFLSNLQTLEYLDISKNKVVNYVPLYHLKNLKTLVTSNISDQEQRRLKVMLPQTKIIEL